MAICKSHTHYGLHLLDFSSGTHNTQIGKKKQESVCDEMQPNFLGKNQSPDSDSFLGFLCFTYMIENVSVPRSEEVAQTEYPVASDRTLNLHSSTH
jgi:hypothetical protein